VATATISNGKVTVITVDNASSGYTSVPTVITTALPVPTVTLWSNDNSSTGGAEPGNSVPIDVSNGHYAFGLGDTNLPNVTITIPASIFAGIDNALLRLWFSTDAAGPFEKRTPDRHFLTGAYTFQAAQADSVADGSITSTKLANDSVTSAAILDGTVKGSDIIPNSLGAGQIANETIGSAELASNSVTAAEISLNAWSFGDEFSTSYNCAAFATSVQVFIPVSFSQIP